MKQLNFATLLKTQTTFGGSLLKSGTHPKSARPLDSKLPFHLVMRAERSAMRLPRNFAQVNATFAGVARKYGVRPYEYANVGNHLHAILKLPRRRVWSAFIRELAGRIARATGQRWLARPFTRVVAGWRKAFARAKFYVVLNRREADHGPTRTEARSMLSIEKLLTG